MGGSGEPPLKARRGDLELIGALEVGNGIEQARHAPRHLRKTIEVEASFTVNHNSKGQSPPVAYQLEIIQLELFSRQIWLHDLPEVLFRSHFQEFQISQSVRQHFFGPKT